MTDRRTTSRHAEFDTRVSCGHTNGNTCKTQLIQYSMIDYSFAIANSVPCLLNMVVMTSFNMLQYESRASR